MAEAAVLNDLSAFVEERWWGDSASSAVAWSLSASGGDAGGGFLVGVLACGVGIGFSLWGGWDGGREF